MVSQNSNGNRRLFQPGQSGNPGGRPKMAVEFAQWLRDKKFSQPVERDKLWKRAQKSDYLMSTLLQYAFGKPSQHIIVSGTVTTKTADVYPDGRQVVRESVRTATSPSIH